jgi:hypothetical protein
MTADMVRLRDRLPLSLTDLALVLWFTVMSIWRIIGSALLRRQPMTRSV